MIFSKLFKQKDKSDKTTYSKTVFYTLLFFVLIPVYLFSVWMTNIVIDFFGWEQNYLIVATINFLIYISIPLFLVVDEEKTFSSKLKYNNEIIENFSKDELFCEKQKIEDWGIYIKVDQEYIKKKYFESTEYVAIIYESLMLIPLLTFFIIVLYIVSVIGTWYLLQYFDYAWNQWVLGWLTFFFLLMLLGG